MFGDQDEYVTIGHLKIILDKLVSMGFTDSTMLVGIRRKNHQPIYSLSLSDGSGGPSYQVEIKGGEAIFTNTGYMMS